MIAGAQVGLLKQVDRHNYMTLYDDVMRTIVELPEEQIKQLTAVCRRDRISRAEAIRRAVAKMLDDEKPSDKGISDAFGMWNGRGGEMRKLVSQLRGEWR